MDGFVDVPVLLVEANPDVVLVTKTVIKP